MMSDDSSNGSDGSESPDDDASEVTVFDGAQVSKRNSDDSEGSESNSDNAGE